MDLFLASSKMMRKLSLVGKKMYGMWKAKTRRKATRIMYEYTFYSSSTFLSTEAFKSLPKV